MIYKIWNKNNNKIKQQQSIINYKKIKFNNN